MHPQLFILNIFGKIIPISSYKFFLFLAIFTAISGSCLIIKKSELNIKESGIILIFAILGFFLGARILNVLLNFHLYYNNPARIYAFNATGFSEYGGLIVGAASGWLAARKIKIDVWRLGDLLAPNIGIGIAIMRIGCFLNGCCFGIETNLPWGVRFPLFSEAHLYQIKTGKTNLLTSLPVHPTELYELLAALSGALLTLFLLNKKIKKGLTVLIFFIWFTCFRLFNHFLRVMPPTFTAPTYFYPLFYFLLLILLTGFLINRLNKRLD